MLLKSLGHNVHILEQWKEQVRHDEAAGIRAGPHVQEFFARYDRTQQPYSLPCPGLNFIDKESRSVKFIHSSMAMTSWTTLYFRLRANFDGYASKQCPHPPDPVQSDGAVHYDLGKRVVAVIRDGQHMLLTVQDLISGGTTVIRADLVIAADGSNSTIRQLLLPSLDRPYAGYVAWRGGVSETEVSQRTLQLCANNFTVFKMPQNYILVYKVPGNDANLTEDNVLNWVWYNNTDSRGGDLEELLVDIRGHKHKRTLPPGMIRPSVWQKQVKFAEQHLAEPFVELVRKTKKPFISCVSDCLAPKARFFDGKLLIVGDALAQFRPHVALSANQAAYNALSLEHVLKGDLREELWEKRALQYARETKALSEMIGNWTQMGLVPAFISAFRYVWIRLVGRFLRLW